MNRPIRPPFSLRSSHTGNSIQEPANMAHASYSQPIGRYVTDYSRGTSSSLGMNQPATPDVLFQQPFHQNAQNIARLPSFEINMAAASSPSNAHLSTADDIEGLKRLVHELQVRNEELRTQLEELNRELSSARYAQAYSDNMSNAVSFVRPSSGPIQGTQLTPQLESSWRRRQEVRIRKFCSPNRAGNALCSWHDTRRERRAYPPRMAPEGTLNCGCTTEEALFEESLARHGVGSYLPGDSVRMDSALRNPLLRLLRARYGYRDGDFEWDPARGDWIEGEGPGFWEAELQRHSGRGHR